MWIVGILGFLLGITLGCIAAYLVFSRNGKTRHLQSELNELKERFTDYRDQVTAALHADIQSRTGNDRALSCRV